MLTPPHSHWYGRDSPQSRASSRALPTAFNVANTHNATSKRGSVESRPTCPSTALISLSQDLRSSVQTAAQTTRTGWSASSRSSSDAQRISTWSRIGRRSRGLPAGIDWAAWAGEEGSGKLSGLKSGSVMTLLLQYRDGTGQSSQCHAWY